MNNSYITIIKEKRTVLSRKRVPLNQNECTADFRIGVPFEQNLQIFSQENVETALKSIGFYRLRGYSFHLYDNSTKKYIPGIKFEDIIKLYQFEKAHLSV